MKKNIPIFGSNKIQSFIDFFTNPARVRFGLEGKRIFYERNDQMVYMTDEDGNLSDDSVSTSKIVDLAVTTAKIDANAVTTAKLAAALDLTGIDVKYSVKQGTPVNAVSAEGTLTLTGVVIDGEKFTIGTETFEIDTDGNVDSGNIAIDVSAFATASQATLTVTAGGNQIADGDTVTIDTKVYTFKTTLTPTEGEVLIGANDTAALLNLLNAINHTGTPDTDYSCAAVHPTVTGTSSDATTLVATVKVAGTAGDAIASTEVSAELSWDAATFGTTTAGVDCTAADGDGAIVTDVTAGSSFMTATQGAGTTIVMKYVPAGIVGNSIASTTGVMANGSFGDTTLGDTTTGIDGTLGAARELLADTTNIYMAIAANTTADSNWRKLALQAL